MAGELQFKADWNADGTQTLVIGSSYHIDQAIQASRGLLNDYREQVIALEKSITETKLAMAARFGEFFVKELATGSSLILRIETITTGIDFKKPLIPIVKEAITLATSVSSLLGDLATGTISVEAGLTEFAKITTQIGKLYGQVSSKTSNVTGIVLDVIAFVKEIYDFTNDFGQYWNKLDDYAKSVASNLAKVQILEDVISQATDYLESVASEVDIVRGDTDGLVTPGVSSDGVYGDTGSLYFNDQSNNSHTLTVQSQGVTRGTLNATIAAESFFGSEGRIDWVYTIPEADLRALGHGETADEQFVIVLDNGKKGSDFQTVTISSVGTNDEPESVIGDYFGSVSADEPTDIGSFAFGDVDLKDTHQVSVTPGAGSLGQLVPVLTRDTTGGLQDGEVTWSYSIDPSLLAGLAPDKTHDSFVVEVSDGHGGKLSQVVTIALDGSAEPPPPPAAEGGGYYWVKFDWTAVPQASAIDGPEVTFRELSGWDFARYTGEGPLSIYGGNRLPFTMFMSYFSDGSIAGGGNPTSPWLSYDANVFHHSSGSGDVRQYAVTNRIVEYYHYNDAPPPTTLNGGMANLTNTFVTTRADGTTSTQTVTTEYLDWAWVLVATPTAIFTEGNDSGFGYHNVNLAFASDDKIYASLGGNDTFSLPTNGTVLNPNVVWNSLRGFDAGAGDDHITGSSSAEKIFGGSGADKIFGGGGSDILYGGDDDDYIQAGFDASKLYGEGGNDTILGSHGDDVIHGGADNDTIDGHAGNDTIDGGPGDDTLRDYTGASSDINKLDGGTGNDTLEAYGLNELIGGDGHDIIRGNHSIDAGTGDDIIQLGVTATGTATVKAGPGEDVIRITNPSYMTDKFVVDLGTGNDQIHLSWSGLYQVDGGEGHDIIHISDRSSQKIVQGPGADEYSIYRVDGEELVELAHLKGVEQVKFAFDGWFSQHVDAPDGLHAEMLSLAVDANLDTVPKGYLDRGWDPLTPLHLGMTFAGTDHSFRTGVYKTGEGLGALGVMILEGSIGGKSTLSLNFKGSYYDAGQPQIADFLSLDGAYAEFKPLIDALNAYIEEAGIQQVLVTGHSLGASLAQTFMATHPDTGAVSYSALTFGSPGGVQSGAFDDRIVNFIDAADPVPRLADGLVEQPRNGFNIVVNLASSGLGETDAALHSIVHYEELYSWLSTWVTDQRASGNTFPLELQSIYRDKLNGFGSEALQLTVADTGVTWDKIVSVPGDDYLLGTRQDDRFSWGDASTITDEYKIFMGSDGIDSLELPYSSESWSWQWSMGNYLLSYKDAGGETHLVGEVRGVEKLIFSAPNENSDTPVFFFDHTTPRIIQNLQGQTGTALVDPNADYVDVGGSDIMVTGSPTQDIIMLGSGSQRIEAGAGNDIVTARTTAQVGISPKLVVSGGLGDDVMVGSDQPNLIVAYSGNMVDYDFRLNADGSIAVRDLREGSPDGNDTLWSVESLVFANGHFTLSVSNGVATLVPGTSMVPTNLQLISPTGTLFGQPEGSIFPSLSGDGTKIAFESRASDIVPGDTNNARDVYVKNLTTGSIERVSTSSSGAQANNDSFHQRLSSDGSKIFFSSNASNLVASDTNAAADVFVKDLSSGVVTRLSTSSSGAQANGLSFLSSVSDNGNFAVFQSVATNLLPGDANGAADLWIKDITTGQLKLVSSNDKGEQGNGFAGIGSVSADGRYVAFSSTSTNLVAGDTNGVSDVFIKDTVTGSIVRITGADGQLDGGSFSLAMSANGAMVAFLSRATGLGNTDEKSDLFIYDVASGAITRVANKAGNEQNGTYNNTPSFTSNGSHLIFESSASNLVEGDTNGKTDAFMLDVVSGEIILLSRAIDGGNSNGNSFGVTVSSDRGRVAFSSEATNLTNSDTNLHVDVFVLDIDYVHAGQDYFFT